MILYIKRITPDMYILCPIVDVGCPDPRANLLILRVRDSRAVRIDPSQPSISPTGFTDHL